MAGGIFLIQGDDKLIEMSEKSYDSEKLLQELIAKYPNLLAGDQINRTEPRKWLLVSQEISLPSEEVSGRWSLDHLFLDQDGIPTLVEVKRSTDTRIRREVVGQMLDYAANAVAYWPIQEIKARFEQNCEKTKIDSEQKLLELLGENVDHSHFWESVETNLRAGKVRLVFVADIIPSELQRIVEFLNTQMNPAEVIAIEIRQFVGEEMKTLVSRVIGHTKEAISDVEWNESTFTEEITKHYPKQVEIVKQIFNWSKKNMSEIWWGKGKATGSFIPLLHHKGINSQLFVVWTNGSIQIPFGTMKTRPPLDDENKRMSIFDQLNSIPGIHIPRELALAGKYPSFSISILENPDALNKFFEVLDWAVQLIKLS